MSLLRSGLRRLPGRLATLLRRSGLSLREPPLRGLHGLLALRRLSLGRWVRLRGLALWLPLRLLLLWWSLWRLLLGWLALLLFTGLSWILVWVLVHRSYCVGGSVVGSCSVLSLIWSSNRPAVAFSDCCGGRWRSAVCWSGSGGICACCVSSPWGGC